MQIGPELDDHVRNIATQLADGLSAAVTKHREATSSANEPVRIALRECLGRLTELQCWGRQNQVPSSLLWNQNAELLRRGSLQRHAREKPLGYAGDFRLLDRICREDVTQDPIGKAMDLFFQSQAAPQAVRNRCRFIADRVAQPGNAPHSSCLRVASIGSGPAWELQWAIDSMEQSNQLELTLIDIDPRALQFCKARLAAQPSVRRLETVQANLGRLPRLKKVLDATDGSDLIYCAGFFDYLDDVAAISMLRALWDRVTPGGELLVFNFNIENPSRAYMEWIGNWYLVYRSPESLKKLAEAAQLPAAAVDIGVEPAGVNLFLRCRKRP